MVSYLILLPLLEEFLRGSHSQLYIIAAEVFAIFIDADTRVKGTQKGDHKRKIVDFADDTIIFLKEINCLTKMGLILKLYETPSNSKINLIQKGFVS